MTVAVWLVLLATRPADDELEEDEDVVELLKFDRPKSPRADLPVVAAVAKLLLVAVDDPANEVVVIVVVVAAAAAVVVIFAGFC